MRALILGNRSGFWFQSARGELKERLWSWPEQRNYLKFSTVPTKAKFMLRSGRSWWKQPGELWRANKVAPVGARIHPLPISGFSAAASRHRGRSSSRLIKSATSSKSSAATNPQEHKPQRCYQETASPAFLQLHEHVSAAASPGRRRLPMDLCSVWVCFASSFSPNSLQLYKLQ